MSLDVYFNQQLGAPHVVEINKTSFSDFSVANGKKERKAQKITKNILLYGCLQRLGSSMQIQIILTSVRRVECFIPS